MLTNAIHRWSDVLKLRRGENVRPHFVDFHTSDICNHKCIGCAYRDKHGSEMMSEADHLKAIIRLSAFGVRAFDFAGGGEPTLMPYLPRMMDAITNRGGVFGLITNGSNLTDAIIEALLRGGTYLRVSLEASTPWLFRKYKQVPAIEFVNIIDRVRHVVQVRNARGSKLQIGIKFGVSKILRGTLHYQMMFDLAAQLGVDRITVRCLSHFPEELSGNERYAEYALFSKLRPAEHAYEIKESFFPNRFESVPQCYLNPLHTVMDHKGNIYLCCYYYYRQEKHKIGNILDSTMEDIWMTPEHIQKIKEIDRDECAKVDCKFFRHHQAVEEAATRGQIYFL
ncbi:MAG TPA: hypothetical protein DGH68_05305 [Bacteroidetes bacterium]|jgi:radical SAM protein with 4Fe4S-binding SPASM domain|nr:hypothetical protein [Bacteroidota bacterium]